MPITYLTHYGHPNRKVVVTHDPGGSPSDTEIQSVCAGIDVYMEENAVWNAELLIPDEYWNYYSDTITTDDLIKIYLNYAEAKATLDKDDLRFFGFVEDVNPYMSEAGKYMRVILRGSGQPLVFMLCGQQYGTESTHRTVDTAKEILTDATYGIIPKYVNKILGSATNSGHNLDTTYVEDIAGSHRYHYFPFVEAKRGIDTVQDYLQALQGTNAGAHYIVRTIENPADTFTHYFIWATVGNHPSNPINIASVWPNWFLTDQDHSTIEVARDMTIHNFLKRPREANYILYHGRFMMPPDGDKWTEQTPFGTYWATTNCSLTTATGADYKKVGSASLQADPDTGLTGYWAYPVADADWDFTALGGQLNIPTVNFFIKANGAIVAPIFVRFYSGVADYFDHDLTEEMSDKNGNLIQNEFFAISLPVGPYSQLGNRRLWVENGSPVWTAVDCIRFGATDDGTGNGSVWLDGLCIAGHILRAAKKSGESWYKLKLVSDDLGKDDTTKSGTLGTTDVGTMARLAKAELYRAASIPLQGTIVLPAQPQALPGQKAHIHALKTAAGAFKIDTTMRIMLHQLSFRPRPQGFRSYFTLTDDLVNGYPMQPYTAFNILKEMVNPEFQTKQISSIKTRTIDVTQNILEESYTF